jgi:hypothetical protein
MQISVRRGFVLGTVGIFLIPLSAKALTEYRGARVANEICAWVNGQTFDRSLNVGMGPQARAILDDLRERGSPVACDRESSPHLDNFWTETAVVIRSTQRPIVGLRIAPGLSEPQILGYWTQ